MDIFWIWLLITCYLISILVGVGFNWNATETEFCKQNDFLEYKAEGIKDFCINKQIEGNKIIFEKKEVYCVPEYWFEMFYFQPKNSSCYFVEVVKWYS